MKTLLFLSALIAICIAFPSVKEPQSYAFETKHEHGKGSEVELGSGSGDEKVEEKVIGMRENQEENNLEEGKHPKYQFAYGVKDPHTGDLKEAWEIRDGDHVEGMYALLEPNGNQRVVKYHANDKEGFNAVVKTFDKNGKLITGAAEVKPKAEASGDGGGDDCKSDAVSYQKVHKD